MTAARTTRTLNPLHFEDLEPHRFEDLVRQLAYQWRTWQQIEATGRLGADEGIDIRGIEVAAPASDAPDEGEADETSPLVESERLWIFQCKREKRIGPSAARDIVQAAIPDGSDAPHGFVLAAACDFSKKTRDAVRAEAASRGVVETHLWGKAEIEDLLFLPQHDHLLFAYFNISIQVRKRALSTRIRSRLAMKRKLVTVFGGLSKPGEYGPRDTFNDDVLLRDPDVQEYPFRSQLPDFDTNPAWGRYSFVGHPFPDHVAFEIESAPAYLDDERKRWDFMSLPAKLRRRRHWRHDELSDEERKLSARAWAFEQTIPRNNQSRLLRVGFIHYDRVLAVDEYGDVFNEGPHLLVTRDEGKGFFDWEAEVLTQTWGGWLEPDDLERIEFFPDELPDPPPLEDSASQDTES